MRKTKSYEDVQISNRVAVNTDQLRAMLSCGRATAEKIGDAAGARIRISGRRVLWSMDKIKEYLERMAG